MYAKKWNVEKEHVNLPRTALSSLNASATRVGRELLQMIRWV